MCQIPCEDMMLNVGMIAMGVGRGTRGPCLPWIFKVSAKKGCILDLEWEKTNFTTIDLPWKNFEKII